MAKQQGRFFRPKPAALKGTPYDSMTEKRLHEGVLSGLEHHCEKINYTVPHRYEPDFVYRDSESVFYLEVKGYFQDASELQKYKHVKKSLGEGQYLVFVFETPHKPIHFQKKRSDGTKMTHAQWAEKEGFMWFTECTIKNLVGGDI